MRTGMQTDLSKITCSLKTINATTANTTEVNACRRPDDRILETNNRENGYSRCIIPIRSNTSDFSILFPPRYGHPIVGFIEPHREQAAHLNCERIFSATSRIPPIRRTQILGLHALLELLPSLLRRRVDIEFCVEEDFPHKAIARWAVWIG